jgi:hypothetical protein
MRGAVARIAAQITDPRATGVQIDDGPENEEGVTPTVAGSYASSMMAPAVGFEPTTNRLTADRSAS